LVGRALLSADTPHFIQVGDAPVFRGTGAADLVCGCGQSVLVKGYMPANLLGIRIRCFRCGAVTAIPGLPEGEILPREAEAVDTNELAVVETRDLPWNAVLADRGAIGGWLLTRPNNPLDDALVLTPALVEAAAERYDRLTGGRLAAQIEASPPPSSATVYGDYPFAWSVTRLREQINREDWSWLQHNDDAMAAMHVVAMHHCLDCWGQHPLLAELAAPLALPGQFLRVLSIFATAKLLYQSGNRVGFAGGQPGLHFSTPLGEPLSLALLAPDALQWRAHERCSPSVVYAAVTEALASSQGRVNTRHPGLVMLSVSILQPEFDQMLVDAIHAAFAAFGRRHRGVAALAVVMPKVLQARSPDRIGFGWAFYPILNPSFRGENPVRLTPARQP
jgi:hypothetical protein